MDPSDASGEALAARPATQGKCTENAREGELPFPPMRILGIETSCDETACGVVEDWRVLSNVLHTQEIHGEFGGVVPEIASREHLRLLPGIVRESLRQAGLGIADMDGVCFTRGPGLAGPLLVGASFARALALEAGLPLWGVNHLEGHLAAVRLTFPDLAPPFLCLTVSGGHTEFTRVSEDGSFLELGATRDDAAGEAFDKAGKLLGLGYPAGPVLSREALAGDREAFPLPRGLLQDPGLDLSFSGLKTAILRETRSLGPDGTLARRADLCASIEEAIVDTLVEKSVRALEREGLPGIAVCGGVSANRRLRAKLALRLERKGLWARFPDPALCTDNGAMIAAACMGALERGVALPVEVDPRLSLSSAAG